MRGMLFVVVVGLAGCATVRPVRPVEVSVSDTDAAFTRGMQALVAAGYPIAAHDRESGVIQTEWVRAELDAGRQLAMDTVTPVGSSYQRRRISVLFSGETATVRLDNEFCAQACRPSPYVTDDVTAQLKSIAEAIGQ